MTGFTPRQPKTTTPWTYHLPSDLRSPGVARILVRDALAGLPPETIAMAQVLVSELVTNAVLHADPPIHLDIRLDSNRIRVDVHDGSELHPQARSVAVDAMNGRGLPLVEALSTGWGWSAKPDGKSVWFEL
jgi:anti-sigma regulatory factor (Ser/Thr protein kinase)